MAYKDEVYWIERDKIAIAKLDRTATSIANEFHDTDAVTGKTGPTESPNIPAEFHEALTYYVLDRLYSINPQTIQVAGFWKTKFDDAIRSAKRYANTGRDGVAPKIKPMEY